MATSKLKSHNTPLWSGTWTSGSISVDGIDKYTIYRIITSGHPAIGIRNGNVISAFNIVSSGAGSQTIRCFMLSISGSSVSMREISQITHNVSSGHGAKVTPNITAIYGII